LEPIPASKFEEQYNLLRYGSGYYSGFQTEFGKIGDISDEATATKTLNCSNLPHNLVKNRYGDVLPYDDTRVILTAIDNVEGSDYINANWISDIQGNSRSYICTQGPLENTIFDFWRMIIEPEFNISVIIMLVTAEEKDKCCQYFPLDGNALYEDINVELVNFEQTPTIFTRTFRVVRGDIDRVVTHLHFTAWPDHGVPSPEEDYIALSDKADEANSGNNPIVVHCSAGVGRSGTFCIVHSYLHYIRDFVTAINSLPSISVAQSIVSMRNERMKMVQTPEQYEFCYKTIFKEFKKIQQEIKNQEAQQQQQQQEQQ